MTPFPAHIRRQGLGGLLRPSRPLLLAGAARLALAAAAFAGGDGLVVRWGGAELRSDAPRGAGKTPVVFVHGMLGSPGNWSALIDQLSADLALRGRYQFLTFGYDSLQPIPDSAQDLLGALAEARRRCDPGDATGGLWAQGKLIGKVGSAFTSTASQHGGQETTLIHMHTFFYHQGMVVAGVPYAAQELLNLDEISGGTPYGASTVAGPRGERTPTANELAIARFQGRHVAQLAAKLAAR